MSLTNPNALVLLLLLPVFITVGRPRTPYRRIREISSLLIRLVIVCLIIFSLAGAQILRASDQLAVVFLVDISDSMDVENQQAAVDYVRTAIENMSPDRDQAAVVLFGADAVVEHPMSDALDLGQIGADPITLNTDVSEAIRLALALFPPEAAKRIVILSDGIETIGDADSASQLAAANSVQIDYVSFQNPVSPDEILVKSVTIPPHVNEEETFDLVVNIQAESATEAELRVFAGGTPVYTEQVALRQGENRFAIGPLNLPESGFVDFRVQVEPLSGEDGFYQNNQLSAFTEVRGRPRILIVSDDPMETEYLIPALQESGLVIDTTSAVGLPSGLATLSAYDSIILANVSALRLSPSQMDALQIYVRDLGGGLVTIGGPQTYGVGGYFQTPLEETLPVEMRIRDPERIPTLTMLFVIDRSGSMQMSSDPSGFTHLELAKEAILRSFRLLQDYDRVGVISFDTQAYFVLDLQQVGDEANRQAMANVVGSLRPGGGTDIFGAVLSSGQVLPADPSNVKHIILLTDGGANPTGVLEATQAMYQNYGITLSVVAVGEGYALWLRDLARAGQGTFHKAMSIHQIPAIFTAETLLATRSYIIEEEFLPVFTARSPIMEGISAPPSLNGYVAATEKDTATVILRDPTNEDPILASWQYGLGRAVAFTSDANARWGTQWVTWADFARFWSQAIRWTITEGSDSNLEARVEQRGEQSYLIIDARDDDGALLNGLSLNAAIVNPQLESDSVTIPQVAPGRYEVAFNPRDEGAYFIRVVGSAGEDISVAQTTGWVLSYSTEYAPIESDPRFLARLAAATGGTSVDASPENVFDHNLLVERASTPIWPYLLLLALFLLIFDIAIRRLVINRSDIQRALDYIRPRFGSAPEPVPATTGRMTNLMEAKRRASVGSEQDVIATSKTTERKARPAPLSRPRRESPTPTPSAKRQEPQEGSLASRLLERRKEQDQ